MKKQILFFAFLILISASNLFAQTTEQQATKIRQLYADTNKRIDDGLKDKTSGFHYAAWTIGGERDGQQWSAIGTMETRNEFWFDGEPNMDAEATQDARKLVRKIVSSHKAATNTASRSEYLFDEKGELFFVFSRGNAESENGATLERRFYFIKGKLIRIVRGSKNVDAKFSAADLNAAQNESDLAKRLQNLFALMMAE